MQLETLIHRINAKIMPWIREILHLILEELRPSPHPEKAFEEDVAGGLMTAPLFTLSPDDTVGEARKHIPPDFNLCRIPVHDSKGCLLGAVPVTRMFTTDPHTRAEDCMEPLPAVSTATPVSHAIATALEAATPILAVTDNSGRLQGVVPSDTLMHLVHDRYGEVLKRFTGIRENSEQAVTAIEGEPGRRVIHRIPWLLVGTFGSMIATLIMAGFENILRSNVEVAFFIPGLVYLADAIGTQSEAIAVRGLSFSKTSIKRLWWGELQTGLLLGLILALLVFPFIWIAFSASLALAVALALVFASSVATSIGLLFPWILTQLGKDPAYGSGPIATIIQDLLSLLIYFIVVYWLVF